MLQAIVYKRQEAAMLLVSVAETRETLGMCGTFILGSGFFDVVI